MWYSIWLKERLKLRWVFFASLLLTLGFCIKVFLDIRQQMNTEHAEMVWYQAIHLQTVFHRQVCYLPLLIGLAMAAAQFVPEILGRRIRISLHLPIAREVMVLLCLLTGLLHVVVVCILVVGLTQLTLGWFFPWEVARYALLTMIPWYLAGLSAYLGGVAVLLETAWPRRLFLFFVFSVLIGMMFSGRGYGWFTPVLPWLIGLVPPALLSVFESARRFQQRGT